MVMILMMNKTTGKLWLNYCYMDEFAFSQASDLTCTISIKIENLIG